MNKQELAAARARARAARAELKDKDSAETPVSVEPPEQRVPNPEVAEPVEQMIQDQELEDHLSNTNQQRRMAQLEAQLAETQQTLRETRQAQLESDRSVKAARAEADDATDALRASEHQLSQMQRQVAELNAELAEARKGQQGSVAAAALPLDVQSAHILALCQSMRGEQEAHSHQMAACVAETRQALKVMKQTCPKFSMLARTSGSVSPVRSPGSAVPRLASSMTM